MGNSFDGFDPQEKIKELIRENSRLTVNYERAVGRYQYLEAENALLRAALEAVEYVDFNDCPWCGLPKYNNNTGDVIGHAPDCLRQRALGLEAQNV